MSKKAGEEMKPVYCAHPKTIERGGYLVSCCVCDDIWYEIPEGISKEDLRIKLHESKFKPRKIIIGYVEDDGDEEFAFDLKGLSENH